MLGAIFFLFWAGIIFFISALGSSENSELFSKTDGIGVIELKGIITSSEEIVTDLAAFQKNSRVKAIILRVDSPGGAVGASQEIFTEIKRTNGIKPVIVSMGSMAASGAYYASLGAQKIIANPGTLTGSLGVIIKFPNLENLFEKIGYKSEVVKSGANKDIGSATRPMTAEERNILQALIDNVHEQFINDIAKSRALAPEVVRKLADGRIYSGEQAKDLGLIDDFGNFADAIKLAATLAGLPSETPHLIFPKEKKFSLLTLLAGETGQTLTNRFINISPILSYELTFQPQN
ncbi:MAG: signal peptide peptidase SppA [Proteobacteria bacterium]|nr:signal peptide peptidase SppA [Pseudomonadota bacterium]MBU1709744.1 signal peptide peptidase SppA [Pseudomonadota bacterium]